MSTYTTTTQTRAFGLAFAVTSIISAVLVWVKETNEALLAFMKSLTSHHWITHGLFVVIVFFLLGLLFSKSNGGQGPDIEDEKLIKFVAGSFLLGAVLIVSFYLFIG